jgi:hypothetical protein
MSGALGNQAGRPAPPVLGPLIHQGAVANGYALFILGRVAAPTATLPLSSEGGGGGGGQTIRLDVRFDSKRDVLSQRSSHSNSQTNAIIRGMRASPSSKG